MSTATSSLELEDYPVQNLKVVKSLDDGGDDFLVQRLVTFTIMVLAMGIGLRILKRVMDS